MHGSTPVAKKYARLWEISIVIALRDMQWKLRLPAASPEPYLPISGDLEQSGADAALRINSRLFFFEIKADKFRIKEEWSKKNRKRKSKLAYRSALRAMLSYDTVNMPGHLPRTLHQSLQCHHFVYWSSTKKIGSSRTGGIHMTPYLLGTIQQKLRNLRRTNAASEAIHRAYCLGVIKKGNLAHDPPRADFSITPVTPFGAVGSKRAALLRTAPDGNVFWSHLGLELAEFRQYLEALFASQGKVHHRINAVVMSADGEFFQHITDTAHLEKIFLPRREAQLSAKQRGAQSGADPGLSRDSCGIPLA